jgi:formyl-CoA transferase
VIGRSDVKSDPRLKTRTDQVVNFELVDDLIENWTKGRTKDEVAS